MKTTTRQIFLDTETTGLEPKLGHRIIEIGCVEYINRKPTNKNFHFYLNPDRDIDVGAQRVHGLSREFLANKPRFNEIEEKFLDYIDGGEIIIHNAPFDLGFLNHELALINKQNKKIESRCQITDTLKMARRKHPGQRNILDALCKRYYVDNTHRELHGALLDAQILAQVYLAMTGGQGSLFETADQVGANSDGPAVSGASQVAADSSSNSSAGKTNWNLEVVKADQQESQQHSDYLKKITE